MPVLITDEQQVLEESLDIMLWTLQDQQHCFALGGGAAAQREFIETFDQQFKPLLDQYKYHRTGRPPASYYRDQCGDWLQRLDAMLVDKPYLLGQQPQLLDLALLPFVRQFAHVDRGWFQQAPYPRLRQWLSDWLEDELFTSVMHKYQPWQEGAPVSPGRRSYMATATEGEANATVDHWNSKCHSGVAAGWGVSIVGADQGKQYADVAVFVWCGIFAFGVQWLLSFMLGLAPYRKIL